MEYTYYKLIDGRSGDPMGFTIKVPKETDPTAKIDKAKERASIKKSCPIQMIEVKEYTPYKRRSK